MKKLFFFRSSSSNNENNNSGSLPSTDKQVYWEMPLENELNSHGKAENGFRSPKGFFSKSRKQVYDNSSSSSSSFLRRSRSMSSAAFTVDEPQNDFSCIGDQSRSPASSISSAAYQQREHPSGSSSSNVSSKVLDRYIDGEQELERSKPKSNTFQRNFAGNGNFGGRLPPRIQYTNPASPTDGVKDKPRSHSFREAKGTRHHFSSKEWVDNGFGHESPRRLAKNVIARLSQTHSSHKSSLKEFNYDVPITIEDIYGGALNKCFDSNVDVPSRKSYSAEEPYEISHGYHTDDFAGSQKQLGNNFVDLNSVQTEDAVDAELQQRSKEAEERVLLLSEELDQECFLPDSGFDVPSLIHAIRNLTENKLSLAIEVSGLLVSRISERDTYKEELSLAKSELESQTKRLEKEKSELQTALEKELDRRSSDWSSKLEKYQLEEKRLRERVRELAEQNVSLQREVSSFSERETESRSVITYSEQQLGHLNSRVEEVSKENHDLRENLSELQEKHAVVEEDLNCIKRNFKEKDKECKELQKSIARLLRMCSEQGKTIEGLREAFSEEIEEKQSLDKFEKHVMKLQMEQMRLTGVELALRREVESHRIELDSLRQENIILLNRLKGKGEELGALTFKLDKEMWTRTCCLQNEGLSMLKDSTHLCSKLLELIKGGGGGTKQGLELRCGLDGQFFVEADIKVQGFKRGTENLARSLQTISSLLQEKPSSVASKFELTCANVDGSGKPYQQTLEDALRCELKAETLLTSLLREKLYSKELEVEQLQAELAAAVRGNDILRSEVQNAMDNLSCASHKLKDFELQMQKKDENVSRLRSDLQESLKELTVIRGILPKVSEERDLMWEEVKQYNEKNMLLNSELNILKKKIEALDEDILLKEGQITILKDTLGSKPFDLLASPDHMQEFLLK
ncbi:ATP binding protein, putative [Ricinus communis]|uniref:ATP binding protein, putative n=1 Tax=Ricinus communis TaxID=3988 RepID=B9SGE9_RICCO|nr:ATP binding protein, putative [Ricinus communis]